MNQPSTQRQPQAHDTPLFSNNGPQLQTPLLDADILAVSAMTDSNKSRSNQNNEETTFTSSPSSRQTRQIWIACSVYVQRTFVVRQQDESPRHSCTCPKHIHWRQNRQHVLDPYSCTDSAHQKTGRLVCAFLASADHIGKSKPTLFSALTTAASYKTVPFGGRK